ncbi:MAG: glycosyltransferase family 39 protein [Anaerolineae bacterium]
MALSPAFIIESAQITTETVFMALLAGGLTLFVEAVYRGGMARPTPTSPLWWIGAAVLLGLAALTRAVLIVFPFALAVYWLIVPPPDRRFARRLGQALAFGAVYLAVVLTWTGYNWVHWNRLVFGGGDISAFLYIGATGWADPQEVDHRLETQAGSGDPNVRNYAQGAASAIASDPMAYVKRRLSEWSGSILQPHGTVYFGGESLRDLGVRWLTQDRSLNGLVDVIRGDAFGSKLVIYVFHYTALFFGLIGMWRVRRAWPLMLPLLAYIGYTAALHLFILALPRYWFPTMIFWTVFAACAFFGAVRKEQTA